MTGGLLALAFSAGALAFAAPCAFPLLPGYVAFFVGAGDEDDRPRSLAGRAWQPASVGLLASAGFFVVFLSLGGVVWAVGTGPLRDVSLLEPVVGVLLVGLGAAMAAGLSPQLHVKLPERERSASSFFLFGVVYAAAAAGCTAPLFLAVMSASLASGPVLGGATLLAYAGGMSVMMIAVTGAAAVGRDQVLRRLSASTGRIQRVAGVLLVVAGVTQVVYWLFWLGGRRELATLLA